jgi:hypothetical protein
MKYRFLVASICVCIFSIVTQANSALSKKECEDAYNIISQDLLNNVGEL